MCSGSTGEMKELRTLLLGGRACDLRSGILPMSLRISESQFPQLQNGDGVLLARTCCHWNEIMVGKHVVNDEASAHGQDCWDLPTAVSSDPWQRDHGTSSR